MNLSQIKHHILEQYQKQLAAVSVSHGHFSTLIGIINNQKNFHPLAWIKIIAGILTIPKTLEGRGVILLIHSLNGNTVMYQRIVLKRKNLTAR